MPMLSHCTHLSAHPEREREKALLVYLIWVWQEHRGFQELLGDLNMADGRNAAPLPEPQLIKFLGSRCPFVVLLSCSAANAVTLRGAVLAKQTCFWKFFSLPHKYMVKN